MFLRISLQSLETQTAESLVGGLVLVVSGGLLLECGEGLLSLVEGSASNLSLGLELADDGGELPAD